MEAIKSYTDIEQSKKLSQILPLESADMTYYACVKDWRGNPVEPKWGKPANLTKEEIALPCSNFQKYEYVHCWSLAALLDVLKKYGLVDLRFLSSTFDGRGNHLMNVWCCTFDNINTVSFDLYTDNPVDACYEMILKLHEQNLL